MKLHRQFSSCRMVVFAWAAAILTAGGIDLPSRILSGMGSQEFREREAAGKKVLEWAREEGEPAMMALLRQSLDAEDPEIRERCLGALRTLVTDEYLSEGEGYMGIMRQDDFVKLPGEAEARNVVRVLAVVQNSAAEQAGLRAGDQIVAMNGGKWREGQASEQLGEQVRVLKPKTKVPLKVFREGKVIDLEVVLGRRPGEADNPFFGGLIPNPEAMDRAAKEAYFRRWLSKNAIPD